MQAKHEACSRNGAMLLRGWWWVGCGVRTMGRDEGSSTRL